MNSKKNRQALLPLLVSTLGVVYGDIGTSPLYAIRQAFVGYHPLAVIESNILGVLSLLFWTVMLLISVKYIGIMMRADNRGEGGSLALLALVLSHVRKNPRLSIAVSIMGIFAASLFYGDSMITPAISVLSAVEGLHVVAPAFQHYVLPITIVIITLLFLIQRRGTGLLGLAFGPIIAIWFFTIALLGVMAIIKAPQILAALNPAYAFWFFYHDPLFAFLSLGAVVLAVTGGEVLYADMGHFGKMPIRLTWFGFVMPSLILNYFGQGALLLQNPDMIINPFYLLAPEWGRIPLLVLATAATIIASQAVISGSFSVARQAMQMDLLPRMTVRQTSGKSQGQIYVPFINWMLYISIIALVLFFQSSDGLASAYGIAVTGTMLIDTILVSFVIFLAWRWWLPIAIPVIATLFIVDLVYFASNLTKITNGGWFPLLIGLLSFITLTTWREGRKVLSREQENQTVPLDTIIQSLDTKKINRAKGTAVFMMSAGSGTPSALLHNLKHNQVLHERNVFLTVVVEDQPYVPSAERVFILELSKNCYRLRLHYGFMETPNIPRAFLLCAKNGLEFDMMSTSFFLSRATVIPTTKKNMAIWRERLFSFMTRNAVSITDYLNIPANRVVEIGVQIEI